MRTSERSNSSPTTHQFASFLRSLIIFKYVSIVAILAAVLLVLTYFHLGSSTSAIANKVNINGTVYLWKNQSIPQNGVQIEVRRDGRIVAGGQSDQGGRFNLNLDKGSPVIIIFRYTGYMEGRVICGTTDREDQSIGVTLLSYQEADARWGYLAREYFDRPGALRDAPANEVNANTSGRHP